MKSLTPGQGDEFYHANGIGEMIVYAAYDFENFPQPRPDVPTEGVAKLKEAIRFIVENKWPFRLYTTYNETIDQYLTAFEEINREVPFDRVRWFFDHAETITPKNIERVRALGGGIAIQDRLAFQGEYFIYRISQPPLGL